MLYEVILKYLEDKIPHTQISEMDTTRTGLILKSEPELFLFWEYNETYYIRENTGLNFSKVNLSDPNILNYIETKLKNYINMRTKYEC